MGRIRKWKALTEEHKKKISMALKGRIVIAYVRTEAHKEKMRHACIGINHGNGHPHTEEHKNHMSELMRGEKNHRWKGGVKPIHRRIRHSLEYRRWRTAVFVRDKWTCQLCQKRGWELQADHIKSFSAYPEFRFDLSNGRTLCKACHIQTETWGTH